MPQRRTTAPPTIYTPKKGSGGDAPGGFQRQRLWPPEAPLARANRPKGLLHPGFPRRTDLSERNLRAARRSSPTLARERGRPHGSPRHPLFSPKPKEPVTPFRATAPFFRQRKRTHEKGRLPGHKARGSPFFHSLSPCKDPTPFTIIPSAMRARSCAGMVMPSSSQWRKSPMHPWLTNA